MAGTKNKPRKTESQQQLIRVDRCQNPPSVLDPAIPFSDSVHGADTSNILTLLLRADGETILSTVPIDFTCTEIESAAYYRLEVEDASDGAVISAVVLPGTAVECAPSSAE